MPTYKQRWTWIEDGFGAVEELFVVSDTYQGLSEIATATEVGIFGIESTKHDLDIDAGVFATNELGFSMSQPAAETMGDIDAIAFVLAARIIGTQRFVARLINPSSEPTVDDFEFIGVVKNVFHGTDKHWSGSEYGTDIQPVREWDCTAYTFDASAILSAKMKDIVDAIPQSWHDSNVADRLGHFHVDQGGGAVFEQRYCNLVALESLIQEILSRSLALLDADLPTPAGITVTYESAATDIWVRPAHWQCYLGKNGLYNRYSAGRDLRNNPLPYKVITPSNFFRLKSGGDPSLDESIYVSSRVISPTSEDERISWLRYDTVADLISALSATFAGYLEFLYDDSTHLRVRITSRSTIDKGPVYLRDAVSAEVDTSATASADDKKQFAGAAWHVSREGAAQYNYDGGGFFPASPDHAAPSTGELLPLTLSPTYCFLQNRGEDFGTEMNDEAPYGVICFPHNSAMWDFGERKQPGVPEYYTEGFTSAMYTRLTGRADNGSVGCTGKTVFAPLGWMQSKVGNEDISTDRLSVYLNRMYRRDRDFHDGEYNIEVPYICSFRSTPSGASDWRDLKLGCTVTLDSVAWIVVGIERKSSPKPSTVIRLQFRDRFSPVSEPAALTTEVPGGVGSSTPSSLSSSVAYTGSVVAAEDIAVDDLVSLNPDDGLIYRSVAHHSHYNRVIGIATSGAAAGDRVVVQSIGRYAPQGSVTLIPGKRIFLRSSTYPAPNWSHSILTDKTTSEDLFLDFGYADTAGTITLEMKARQYIFFPPLS